MRISDWSSDVCSSDLEQSAICDCLTQRVARAREDQHVAHADLEVREPPFDAAATARETNDAHPVVGEGLDVFDSRPEEEAVGHDDGLEPVAFVAVHQGGKATFVGELKETAIVAFGETPVSRRNDDIAATREQLGSVAQNPVETRKNGMAGKKTTE